MQKYNFYEFSGYQLIEKLEKSGDDTLDFSTRIKKSLSGVIKTVESHYENALFDQLKKYLEENRGSEEIGDLREKADRWNEESLKDVLIFINFSDVFPMERYAERKFHWKKDTSEEEKQNHIRICEKTVREFFSNGFCILYSEEGAPVRYVPFEKSASMARTGRMVFIDQRLYLPVEERIRLGFDFCGVKLSVSKLYAYTGLYLSDAKRISEGGELLLNEETVIVLEDNVNRDFLASEEVISGESDTSGSQEGLQKWNIRKSKAGEGKLPVNFFDGEGLISPEYAALINSVLRSQYGMSGAASSFQIRMPFTKGMLHQVDFHGFVCEMLGISSCSEVFIKDAFGKRRNLEKAQIILTRSMFKIGSWLTNEKISGLKKKENAMALYFERFHRYGHAFYVGITDRNLSQAGKTKLNYQFLNTLALSEEEQEEIVKEQAEFITSGSWRGLLREAGGGRLEEDENTSFADSAGRGEAWYTAARHNPAFLKDSKVKGMLKGVRYSLLRDIGRGRLTVAGSTKFLSRDLLTLLSWIINKAEKGRVLSDRKKEAVLKEIKEKRLRSASFFTADCVPGNTAFGTGRKLRLQSKQYYGLLRSPHLSRNEQCSLKPYIPRKDDIYSRYFGHLKGILMVSHTSLVPQTLGGADFDGDLVKLITDARVNRVINDSCYRPDETGSAGKHVRSLPIVVIPSTNPRMTVLQPEKVDFDTLRDTFSNRIGEISNHAIFLGKREYDERKRDPEYALKCEMCTILTGLEIDAAKTGCHPDLEMILEKRDGKDYFVEKKEEVDRLPDKQHLFEVAEYPESKNKKGKIYPHRLVAVAKHGPNRGEELMTAVFTQDYREQYYRIDQLPLRCLEELRRSADAKLNDRIQEEETGVRFLFEARDEWKKKAFDSEKTEAVRDLIYAYKRIRKTAGEVYRIEERLKKSNYVGCINTILKLQYTGLMNEQQITDLQEQIFRQLLERLDSYQRAEEALDRLLKDQKWQYLESEAEKLHYLEERLFGHFGESFPEHVRGALGNFRWNGYFLLYYYIKDIMLYYREAETELRITRSEEKNDASASAGEKYEAYYETFRNIYDQALAEKEPRKIWGNRIVKVCRSILKEMFSGRAEEALMYVHALRSCDPGGTFFWEVFTSDEILQRSEEFSDAE